MLKADGFFQDARLKQAKELLLSALFDAQQQFSGNEDPKPDLQKNFKLLLDDFNKSRGMPLYYPYIGSGLGKGALVELLDGSCKYDLISGIGAHYFGHSAKEMVEGSIDAALQDIVMQGNLQQNKESLDLMKMYTTLSGFDHAFLTTSGAMACENSLKICFQKKYPKTRVLAFERAFAGRTLALSQITDKPSYRMGLPETIRVDYVPFFDPKNPHESTQKAIFFLQSHIRRNPNQHAVMCMELVQGEGGFWTATPEFFKALIHVLKEHDIAVWVDEVQTFARTYSLFAFQHFDLDSLVNVVTTGKASPACATLFMNDFCPQPGLLSQTFTASTSAIYASKCMIQHAIDNNFFGPNGKIARLYQAFTEGLMKLHEKYQCVHGPYGIGAMIAFTPFDGTLETAKKFAYKLFENGVISFIAGADPTRIRFLLPVGAISLADIDPIIQIIEKTIQESLP